MADTYDELQDDITLKSVVILMSCVIKSDDKFYSQLFLEETLFDWYQFWNIKKSFDIYKKTYLILIIICIWLLIHKYIYKQHNNWLNNLTLTKVNAKLWGYDKNYMNKGLIEDKLHELKDQFNKKKLVLGIFILH